MFSLQNKTILIVGATSDIGSCAAMHCAKAGANVWLSGRNEEALTNISAVIKAECTGNWVDSGVCDLSSTESIDAFAATLPKLDGVVFVAGTLATLPCKLQQKEDIEKALQINFNAVVYMTALLLRSKKIAKAASIVFISSVAGNLLAEKGNALYGASKAALAAYAKTLALEVSARKIRVNTIMPGMVKTKFLGNFTLDEDDFKADEAKYPLGYGTPDDVAGGIIYLLSDAARWITGTSLVMDGGRTLQ